DDLLDLMEGSDKEKTAGLSITERLKGKLSSMKDRIRPQKDDQPASDTTQRDGGRDSRQARIDMETWHQGRMKKIQSREDAIEVGNALYGLNLRAQNFARGEFLEDTSEKVKELYAKVGFNLDLRVDSFRGGKVRVTYKNKDGRKLLLNTFSKGWGPDGAFIDNQVKYDGDWKVYQLQDSRNIVLISPLGPFLIVRDESSKYRVWVNDLKTADAETAEAQTVEPKVTALVPAAPAQIPAVIPEQGSRKDGGIVPIGGVDFRAMPAVVVPETAVDQAGEAIAAGITPVAAVDVKDLDRQWSDLQAKVRAGQMPYEDLCGYIRACGANKEACAQLDRAALWVSEVLKMEEDGCVATSTQMKDVLALL
ncbi:MAG: hypothetical protein PHS64_04115, partial [Candidatus Omnitrophica bacterium]|nr:hypothetical protein [Candidatus Omnitrophota bacterium]